MWPTVYTLKDIERKTSMKQISKMSRDTKKIHVLYVIEFMNFQYLWSQIFPDIWIFSTE